MRLPKNEFVFEGEVDQGLFPEGMSRSTGNGANVYSGCWRMPGTPDETADALKEEMDRLAGLIDAAGGIVGHIKAVVSRVEGQWLLSTAGTKSTQKALRHASTQVELAVIVFQTPEDLIANWFCEAVSRLKALPPEES